MRVEHTKVFLKFVLLVFQIVILVLIVQLAMLINVQQLTTIKLELQEIQIIVLNVVLNVHLVMIQLDIVKLVMQSGTLNQHPHIIAQRASLFAQHVQMKKPAQLAIIIISILLALQILVFLLAIIVQHKLL